MAGEHKVPLIFQALRVLISAPEIIQKSTVDLEPLTERLRSNLFSYHTLLKGTAFKDIAKNVDLGQIEATLVVGCDHNIAFYNAFSIAAISLLAKLDDLLKTLYEADENAVIAHPGSIAPTPKALLSFSDQKTLFSVLEFVVSLGLFPYLMPGVDAFLKLRMRLAASVSKAQDVCRSCGEYRIYRVCTVLAKCFSNQVIGPGLITHHLSEVLTALIQIAYTPDHTQGPVEGYLGQSCKGCCGTSRGNISQQEEESREESNKEKCLMLLDEMLRKPYQPHVIRALLILQGIPSSASQAKGSSSHQTSPKWLQGVCGRLLSERLMSKNGVHHVITGIMESTSGEYWCCA